MRKGKERAVCHYGKHISPASDSILTSEKLFWFLAAFDRGKLTENPEDEACDVMPSGSQRIPIRICSLLFYFALSTSRSQANVFSLQTHNIRKSIGITFYYKNGIEKRGNWPETIWMLISEVTIFCSMCIHRIMFWWLRRKIVFFIHVFPAYKNSKKFEEYTNLKVRTHRRPEWRSLSFLPDFTFSKCMIISIKTLKTV